MQQRLASYRGPGFWVILDDDIISKESFAPETSHPLAVSLVLSSRHLRMDFLHVIKDVWIGIYRPV